MQVARFAPQGMGWIPDLPDPRDYTYRHKSILRFLEHVAVNPEELPDEVDLRNGDEGEVFFTPIEDQGALHSSTSFAVLSLIEYYERRAGRTFDSSKLFLYKVVRNLRARNSDGFSDTGSDLRTTFKALIHFGVPSEEFWPYDPAKLNEEPPAFVYQAAKPVTDFDYFRLDLPRKQDPHGTMAEQVVARRVFSPPAGDKTQWNLLIRFLSAGFPVAFGFSVPSSITAEPNIPYRPDHDTYLGGMAAIAVGYDCHRFGKNQGALHVRTSWGSQWGDNGHGWLPQHYVDSQLADDFWTINSTQKD